MTSLESFHGDCNVAIVGASGGIGGALVSLLANDPGVSQLHALARSAQAPPTGVISTGVVDIEDEETISAAAASATQDDALDIVIVASGILWRGDERRPEKAMRELSPAGLAELFAINATGPALVAKHFLPCMRKGSKTVFAALSARVGSIDDNHLGGWYSYRASKAALNMLLKTLAIEHARQRPEAIVAGLHPGTVATGLSQPFTSRTPGHKLFTPEVSARHLLRVIDRLRPDDTGGVFAWDGEPIRY